MGHDSRELGDRRSRRQVQTQVIGPPELISKPSPTANACPGLDPRFRLETQGRGKRGDEPVAPRPVVDGGRLPLEKLAHIGGRCQELRSAVRSGDRRPQKGSQLGVFRTGQDRTVL